MMDSSMKKLKGMIQIYTGHGKGKTTAAMGLALRAAGHGFKTYIGQFIKGQKYGELKALDRLKPFVKVEQFGRNAFIHMNKNPDPEDIQKAEHGLKSCLKAMLSGLFDIIVLDEINVAIYFNLIKEEKVHDFLDRRPNHIEVVLTGRYAPESLIKRADLVTEMKEVKHYYTKKVSARDGIER
jgi:cob(I)alamin adenosyltransferase